MKRGRKNPCPVNISDWLVQVKHPDASEWTRVLGLSTLNRDFSASTEDGSAETDLWDEPIVTKRSGGLDLSGVRIYDEETGAQDPGQKMIEEFSYLGGCEADFDIRITDNIGHSITQRVLCESVNDETDEKGKRTLKWALLQVGEPEIDPYVQATGVTVKDGAAAVSTLAIAMGDADKLLTVAVSPEDASNMRFKVFSSDVTRVTITSVTRDAFAVHAVGPGVATVTVKTVNNALTHTIEVTVSA